MTAITPRWSTAGGGVEEEEEFVLSRWERAISRARWGDRAGGGSWGERRREKMRGRERGTYNSKVSEDAKTKA